MHTPPASANCFKTGSHVDAIAEDVARVDDDIPEVDPDTVFNPTFVGPFRFLLSDRLLNFDRALDGVDNARKLDEKAVAGCLDHPAVMLGDRSDRSAASR